MTLRKPVQSNILLWCFTACTMALLMCACSDYVSDDFEFERPVDAEQKNISLGFYINVGDVADGSSSRSSRATPTDGEYSPGSGYENYIDIEGGDFRIYFFTADNKYIAPFGNPTLERVDLSNSPSSKTYVARTSIESDELFEQITNRSTKIVMLANWRGNYPDESALIAGVSTIDDLVDNAVIEYGSEPWGAVIDKDHRIPLYGVMEFQPLTLVPVMLNLTGVDLHLLRAFAKVEIYQGNNSSADLTGVRLTRYNSRAYCAPLKVYHQDQYIKNTYPGDYTAQPWIPEGAMANTALNLPCYTVTEQIDGRDKEIKHYVVYVPEFRNVGQLHGAQAQLMCTFSDKPEMEYEVEFKYYKVPQNLTGQVKEGDYYDLMRNYWYQIEVVRVMNGLEINVQPYAQVELTPQFGLERDSDGNIVIRDKDGNIIRLVMVDGQQLTFKPFQIPSIGDATGVYDEKGNVQLAYLKDGRMMVYNYNNGAGINSDKDVEIRWELYTSEKNTYGRYLCEEFEEYRWDWLSNMFHFVCLHSYYDERGCLIKRYRYNSRAEFEKRPPENMNLENTVGTVVVDYKDLGNREKDIYYYENGKVYMIVHVRWTDVPKLDDDGLEIEGEYEKELVETYEYIREDK